MIRVAMALLVILLAACSEASPDDTPAPDAGAADDAAAPDPAASPREYPEGAATAQVEIDGVRHEISGGTCYMKTTVGFNFGMTAGVFDKSPFIDVYVINFGGPIEDREYSTPPALVTIFVDDQRYVGGEDTTVTVQNGVSGGQFAGTNVPGTNPDAAVPISGTFDCG